MAGWDKVAMLFWSAWHFAVHSRVRCMRAIAAATAANH
jgi:hypothetical protein